MRKTDFNLIVDALSLVAFAALAATGALIKFRLPPGTGGGHGIGRLHGGGLAVWGMTRHEWGRMHFVLALALVALIGAHLALHWPWICAMIRPRKDAGSVLRRAVALGAAALALALLIVPLFVTPQASDPTTSSRNSRLDQEASPMPRRLHAP